MPRPSVRMQHNAGYKHKQVENNKLRVQYYQKVKEHLGQAAVQYQVDATFNQFLQVNPQRPRLPVLPPPQMPMGAPFIPGVRSPALQPPVSGAPDFLKAVQALYTHFVDLGYRMVCLEKLRLEKVIIMLFEDPKSRLTRKKLTESLILSHCLEKFEKLEKIDCWKQ